MRRSFILLLLLSGCAPYVASMQEDKRRTDLALDEMRLELADLKHTLKGTQVELNILEEKLKKQEALLATNKQPQQKSDPLVQQVSNLEKEIAHLRSIQERTLHDLEHLRSHANETSAAMQSFSQEFGLQNKKFEEISKLKTTLSTLSKSISAPQETGSFSVYRVKSGDTLEKIARMHNTTVAELKRINHLEHDRIMTGQDLKLP